MMRRDVISREAIRNRISQYEAIRRYIIFKDAI